MPAGRYAPSPTSDLHLGNLRTAVLAWLFAASTDRLFRLRIEDLDTDRVHAAGQVVEQQLADLAALGIEFDGPVLRQSERIPAYAEAAARLSDRIYECYCTRREIVEAASAPHAGHRPYPGTCRNLTAVERAARRRIRPAALRIRAGGESRTIADALHGPVTRTVDDFVVRRGDGVWAYNFVVVVDDLAMEVDQVVRGDDLLDSAPRQAWLADLLGGPAPAYAHVPLVLNPAGNRLAKRDGAVSLTDLQDLGIATDQILDWCLRTAGLGSVTGSPLPDLHQSLASQARVFDPSRLVHTPTVFAGPDDLR